MRLVINEHQISIDIKENALNTFLIENEDFFSKLLFNFYTQWKGNEGKLLLFEQEKQLNIPKEVNLIWNPYSLEINDRALLKALYEQMDAIVNEKMQRKQSLEMELISYMEELLLCASDAQITYDSEVAPKEIFKALNLRFFDEFDTLEDKLLTYIRLHLTYGKSKLFVFVNLKSYLSTVGLRNFIKMTQYYGANVLLLESRQREEEVEEQLYILDKDLCFIS